MASVPSSLAMSDLPSKSLRCQRERFSRQSTSTCPSKNSRHTIAAGDMLNHFWKIVKHTTNFDLWLPVKQVFGAVFLAKHEKCQLTQSETTMGEAFLPSTNMERQIAKVSRSCHHGVSVKCASWDGGKGWTCQSKMIQFEIVLAKKSWISVEQKCEIIHLPPFFAKMLEGSKSGETPKCHKLLCFSHVPTLASKSRNSRTMDGPWPDYWVQIQPSDLKKSWKDRQTTICCTEKMEYPTIFLEWPCSAHTM